MARRSRQRDGGSRQEDSLAALARTLGIPPGETAWLEQALTHRSYTREHGEEEQDSNERLEFLGDAVAQFVVSVMLYERYPRWQEGQLTRARAAVVSREAMLRAANRLGLGDHLRLGRSEHEAGGNSTPSIVSSAFEAVVAAVYLTAGIEAAEKLIRSALNDELQNAANARSSTDFKTQLQEYCQASIHKTPVYRTRDTSGPDHARVFTAEVLVEDRVEGTGSGKNKKDAEQAAARDALEAMRNA